MKHLSFGGKMINYFLLNMVKQQLKLSQMQSFI